MALNCKIGNTPLSYLSLPIEGDFRRLRFCYLLLDRIQKASIGLESCHLSTRGRHVLSTFVMSFILVYFFFMFKFSTCIISNYIESLFKRYFFGRKGREGGVQEIMKIPWIKLDKICLEKENRGLGVQRIKKNYLALFGK